MIRRSLELAAVVSAVVPGANPVSIFEMEGTTSDRFDTVAVEDNHGEKWVVRAPLEPTAGVQLETSARLLPYLAERVPFAVPVPVGGARLRDHSRALVYRWLPGFVLSFAALPPGRGMAAHVGECLAHIHNVPLGLGDDIDVPWLAAEDCQERALMGLGRLAATGCIPPNVLQIWETRLRSPHLWRFNPSWVHGNLVEGHALAEFSDFTDATTGRLCAILGWNRVHRADPALDLAPLGAAVSPAAFDSVIESYAVHRQHEFDPALPERAMLMAEITLGHAYATAVASGDRLEKRRLAVTLRTVEDRYLSGDSVPSGPTGGSAGAGAASSAPAPQGVTPPAQGSSVAAPSTSLPDVMDLESSVGNPAVTVNSQVAARPVSRADSAAAESEPACPDADQTSAVPERASATTPLTTPVAETEPDELPAETSDAIEVDHTTAAPTIVVTRRAVPLPPTGQVTALQSHADPVSASPVLQHTDPIASIHPTTTTRRVIPLGQATAASDASLEPPAASQTPPSTPPATSVERTGAGDQESRTETGPPAETAAARETAAAGENTPPTQTEPPTSEPPTSEPPTVAPAAVDAEAPSTQWGQRQARRRERAEHRKRVHAKRIASSSPRSGKTNPPGMSP